MGFGLTYDLDYIKSGDEIGRLLGDAGGGSADAIKLLSRIKDADHVKNVKSLTVR